MITVAVTGGSGLIGGALRRRLAAEGVRVVVLKRGAGGAAPSEPRGDPTGLRTPGANATPSNPERFVRWDPARGLFPGSELEGLDAFIHLAGEPLVALRWTRRKKERILRSRVEGTRLLVRGFERMDRPPSAFISASAVGFYGDRGAEVLTEESAPGTGFLAEVCGAWEEAAAAAEKLGIRTVRLRTGFVLSREGGALAAMIPPFSLGLGGKFGSGEQYIPWIDIEDEVGLILHALRTPAVTGALNASAPGPVTNEEFTRVLARVLNRPTLLPVPAPLLRFAMGEMGRELLLAGQRALPVKAERTGYRFRSVDLEEALRSHLERKGR